MLKYYHPIEPKFKPNHPELVTLFGDEEEVSSVDLKNILTGDDYYHLMGGEPIYPRDIRYYMDEYPELMGFWAALATAVAKVGKGIGKGIGKAVRRKRKRKKAKKARAKRAKKMREQMMQQEFYRQKRKKKQLITLGTIGAAALLLLGG